MELGDTPSSLRKSDLGLASSSKKVQFEEDDPLSDSKMRKSAVELRMKQGDETVYDSPKKRVVFAHEFKQYDSLL